MSVRRPLLSIVTIIAFAFLLAGCGSRKEPEQQPFVIGLVTNNPNGLTNIRGFRDGLAELGYVEGENVSYVFAGRPVSGDELDETLTNLVQSDVDLIFTAGTPTGVAAHAITTGTGIPVVFGVIADPVSAGVMDDLTIPGGNMTGVRLSDNQGRRLQFLLDLAPGIRTVLVPFNPDDPAPSSALDQIIPVAKDLGLEIVQGHARTAGEAAGLMEHFPEDVDAIFMVPDSVVNAHIQELVALAIERKLPLSGPSMIQVEQGALTAYGIIHHNVGVQASAIADLILRGADPGTLPVQTAEVSLGINLQTAQAIGLDVSPDLIQQAGFIVRVAQ
jgi:putative tryptophan/tyrosine transport system substrate-binding protein